MPELIDQMYCSQQIVIPPKFPYALKRYCKAAIKTQPYDLLRWSFEYFTALAENRPPPVKLRLEYPIYSTEGGLTRGCLKVLAAQLSPCKSLPLPMVRKAWRGFCLDPLELKRVFCLCEIYLREEFVSFLHFVAVAAGLLTKSLTHTMILLCETLTKEPDGGSAAIPVEDFLTMYKFLANVDASKDVKYLNGYREGASPKTEATVEEEMLTSTISETPSVLLSDDYWQDTTDLQELTVINDHLPRTSRLSQRLNMPVLGKIERSPSIEREGQIERENYLRERKGRAAPSEEVEKKLRELSASKMGLEEKKEDKKEEKAEKKKDKVEIIVTDEEDREIPYEIYGETNTTENDQEVEEEAEEEEKTQTSEEKFDVVAFVNELYDEREERREDLERTFEEIGDIIDRFKSANYDLGMVAGRQMSTTSGEFIVQHIEREIMDYIDEQIAILPDPDLKKKKAKPEEVAMIREILETFLDENMDVIVPEVEEVEEEEQPIPEVTVVYAVPGIGPVVPEELTVDFENYILEVSKVQADVVMPRNIRHFMCPPLEKYEEYNYETPKKEEVPMGGVYTD
ncbi:uncharacterized protein LOC110998226 [Pieris rapae]|uniref:uncharacterized protein LOC110998226 n=1 Tax=Pieris rapae TaxID=64459 RepID=UPI001E27E9C0|nr:uncharacterized protein LOC110998226 [Pieris rapae]